MKKMLFVFVLLGASGPAAAEQTAGDSGKEQAWAEIERREPGLDQVRDAALRHAGLAGQPERSFGRRARLAGLLPILTLRATRGTGHDQDLSRSSTGTERLDIGSDQDLGLEVKAVWQLDRLVFTDAELRALQAAQRTQRERIQLLTQVTNVYFQRRKLQAELLWAPLPDRGKAAQKALAIAELTAQLDALTGGYFTRALGP